MSGLIGFCIGLMLSVIATENPVEPPRTSVLFEGRLIGITLSRPLTDQDTPINQWRVTLQFHRKEGYCLTAPEIDGLTPIEKLDHTIEIDIANLNEDNYDQLVRQAILPADVTLGCMCMVEGSWVSMGRSVVSVTKSTPESKQEFLSRLMPVIINDQRILASSRRSGLIDHLDDSLMRLTTTRDEIIGLPQDIVNQNAATIRIMMEERRNHWRQMYAKLLSSLHMAEFWTNTSRRVVDRVKNYANESERAILLELDANMEKDLAHLAELRAKLPSEP